MSVFYVHITGLKSIVCLDAASLGRNDACQQILRDDAVLNNSDVVPAAGFRFLMCRLQFVCYLLD